MGANPSRNLLYLVPKLNTHFSIQLLDFLLYDFDINEEGNERKLRRDMIEYGFMKDDGDSDDNDKNS